MFNDANRAATMPLAVFTIFVLGVQAIIGLVLGLSDGLSELHKTVLVAFVCAFPVVTLAMIWLRMPGTTPAATADTPPLWDAPRDPAQGQAAE